jgi:hypothetical protein
LLLGRVLLLLTLLLSRVLDLSLLSGVLGSLTLKLALLGRILNLALESRISGSLTGLDLTLEQMASMTPQSLCRRSLASAGELSSCATRVLEDTTLGYAERDLAAWLNTCCLHHLLEPPNVD